MLVFLGTDLGQALQISLGPCLAVGARPQLPRALWFERARVPLAHPAGAGV